MDNQDVIAHSKPYITADDIESVQQTLKSAQISSGALTKKFEHLLADYMVASSVVAVGSGTAALQLSLLALRIGPGDEVILPTYVCRSVMDAVVSTGAIPVFCDVGVCWNMTPDNVEPLISAQTRAIIVVHIFGISAETRQFLKFGVPLIEDCCQSFGLDMDGGYSGTVGSIGVYSFHATKCLTTGEGGMVLCNDDELRDQIMLVLRSKRVISPLSDLQSALGISQLGKYREMLQRRQELAFRYYERLDSVRVGMVSYLRGKSIFFRFPVKIASTPFESVRELCLKKGIHVRRGVDELLHRVRGIPDTRFPNAASLYDETVSLPIYPGLSDREQDRIIDALQTILN